MTAIAKAPGLTLPSEITEPGWYWAEERIDDVGGTDYQLVMVEADERLDFWIDHLMYDAAAADAWFRIIRRIDEPEITGGWG